MDRPGSTVMKRSTVAGHASDPVTSNAPDPLLDALWEQGLILLGDRVMEEYALQTPIFIDLRHKLYDDVGLLSEVGAALHRKLVRSGREGKPATVASR